MPFLLRRVGNICSGVSTVWGWSDRCCRDLKELAETPGGVLFFHIDLHALSQRTQGLIVGATRPCSLCSVWPIKHPSGRGTLPVIVYWMESQTHTHTSTITFTYGHIWATMKPAAAIYKFKDQPPPPPLYLFDEFDKPFKDRSDLLLWQV